MDDKRKKLYDLCSKNVISMDKVKINNLNVTILPKPILLLIPDRLPLRIDLDAILFGFNSDEYILDVACQYVYDSDLDKLDVLFYFIVVDEFDNFCTIRDSNVSKDFIESVSNTLLCKLKIYGYKNANIEYKKNIFCVCYFKEQYNEIIESVDDLNRCSSFSGVSFRNRYQDDAYKSDNDEKEDKENYDDYDDDDDYDYDSWNYLDPTIEEAMKKGLGEDYD